MSDEEDHGVLKAVKIGTLVLPLVFKLGFTVLKLKRRQKKKIKVFRKTLIKNGMDRETAERLSQEIPELRIREMVSEFGGDDIPGVGGFMD
ncbi:MAG: hypothetical protein R6U61_07360 [Thermoplasmata archaeon]